MRPSTPARALHQQGERGVKQIGAERPVVTRLAGQLASALDRGNRAGGVGEDLHGANHIERPRRRRQIAELLGEGNRLLGERDCKLAPRAVKQVPRATPQRARRAARTAL